MSHTKNLKLLFIINTSSGNSKIDWSQEIKNYFATSIHTIELFPLPQDCNLQTIQEKIKSFSPQCVIAVGGDGTVKLVAECLIQKNIPLGILPAGSANGLAKELGISNEPKEALAVIEKGCTQTIHVTMINQNLCIHLSDIGLNAYAIKKFENQGIRGMWGYLIATLHVLFQNPRMQIEMQIAQKIINISAEMIVIANATQYGSGAVINPIGKLDDQSFEVIVVKKISLIEIFKMVFTHKPYNRKKTEIFRTHTLSMHSAKKVHFQIDGEYLGKINEVKAKLIPDALAIMVPAIDNQDTNS